MEDNVFGDVSLRKVRRKRQKLILVELLYEYAKNSTLHGLRYIVEKGHHLIERGFWFLTFLISLAMCFYLISNVYMKWRNSPVIVSFSEEFVPVGDVPFPSITICPEQKSIAGQYNFSKEYELYEEASGTENFTTEQLYKLGDLNTVCDFMAEVETNRNITNSSMVENILEVAPTVSDVLYYCEWRGKFIECEDNFKAVVTKKGICFNFNALAAEEILRLDEVQKEYSYLNTTNPSVDWTETTGYTNLRKKTYPRRGAENQDNPDLVVFLQEKPSDRDKLCNILKNGYTIYVQHPMDLPQASLYYYAAVPGQVSSIALKFSKVSTAESLKDYPPDTRQCYFPVDRRLRYFRIYTADNCRLECQSNNTFKLCKCVWFHMPHNDSRQICSGEKLDCVQKAAKNLAMAEIKKPKGSKITPCDCLPSCESVQYDAEILKTNLDMLALDKYYEKRYNMSLSNFTSLRYSKIEVYFKEPRFISMRRSELFGVTDFLANCGGLLGLFLGFSFHSLVEIFYFITFRLYYRLRKDARQEKKNTNVKDQ